MNSGESASAMLLTRSMCQNYCTMPRLTPIVPRMREGFPLRSAHLDIAGAALLLNVSRLPIEQAIRAGILPARQRFRLVSHPRNYWTRYYEIPVPAVLDYVVERVRHFGPTGRSRAGRPRSASR